MRMSQIKVVETIEYRCADTWCPTHGVSVSADFWSVSGQSVSAIDFVRVTVYKVSVSIPNVPVGSFLSIWVKDQNVGNM